jgi:preprotein translocase subunit SecD
MSNKLGLKTGLLVAVLAVSAAFGVYPIVAPRLGIARPVWLLERTLKLGLDLRGGVHLVLGIQIPPETAAAERQTIVAEVLETIEHRVNELGIAEPLIASQANGEEVLVQLPGVTDVERAKTIIRETGILELKIVESGPVASRDALLVNGNVPAHTEIVPARHEPGDTSETPTLYYLVQQAAAVSGTEIRTARPSLDENNRPAVSFTLKPEGGRKFGEVTAANIGRLLAVILDGSVESVARIDNRITTEGRIFGNFTQQDVQNLSLILRSGSLPAPLSYLAEETIGASLGADAIRAGIIASAVGLVLVMAFMLAYYRWSGLNAIVAIGLNLTIVLALMSYTGSVMTLPGIAGFVLTIGIGVDSNVLVFERIKEELEAGRSARASLNAGFDRVFVTLLDTHIAALIAAAFLFQFGTGPIRGFAVTLSMGLASNLFTSTFASRTLFELALATRKLDRLSI